MFGGAGGAASRGEPSKGRKSRRVTASLCHRYDCGNILAELELFLKTQRQPVVAKPAEVEQVERGLQMAIAIPHRAGRRLAAAMREMTVPQQKQAQCQLENARRELNRMADESERSRKPDMLSQALRTAILELSEQGVSKHEIAQVLWVSRLSVPKVLRSNSTNVPEIQYYCANTVGVCQAINLRNICMV